MQVDGRRKGGKLGKRDFLPLSNVPSWLIHGGWENEGHWLSGRANILHLSQVLGHPKPFHKGSFDLQTVPVRLPATIPVLQRGKQELEKGSDVEGHQSMVPGALTHSSRTLPDQQRCSWARGWWSLKGPRPGHPRRPGEGPTSHSGARVPTPCPVPTTAQTQLYSPRSSSLTPSQLPSGLVSVLHLGRQ